MGVKEILAEINSMPQVGGTILCSLSGKIIANELQNLSNGYQTGAFSKIILDIFHRFDESKEDFVEMLHPETGNTWIALKYRGLIIIVLLYPNADLYMVKLQLNLVSKRLCEEKEIKKILVKESSIVITTIKQVRILDVLQFQEHIKREGLTKGIILTENGYNEQVKDELEKPNRRIEIIITNDMKAKRKDLMREYERQGFSVKSKAFSSDRWM